MMVKLMKGFGGGNKMDLYLQISDTIKEEVSGILMDAVNGVNPVYRYKENGIEYIRWGLVEKHIHTVIKNNLTGD